MVRCSGGEFALVLHLAIIALLAYAYCQEEIKKRQKDDWSKDLEELKKLNALLQFAVNALKQGRLVKISLKSRKVYMGIIAGEHFEHNDLEHITLIPYFSGHRDKDTLRLQLSRSYLDSYRQLDLIPRPEDSPEQRQQRLEELNHFRLLIRLGEVESLSFFHEALLADHIAPARLDSTPPTES